MLTEIKLKFWTPAHPLVVSFVCVIIAGTLALRLPIATYREISLVDAFFTATSAVCVTGLTTVDVSLCFTRFGQSIIIILVQIGGLGIMTFAAFAVWIVRQKISLSDRMMLEYSFAQGEKAFVLKDFISFIIKYTFLAEFAGAVGFFFSFTGNHQMGEKIFFAVFHSISSFCNAGFSLHQDSFVKYSNSISVNLITCFLVIFGGIGFIVIFELRNKIYRILKRKRRKYRTQMFSLHTWVVLVSTLVLVLAGSIVIYFLEHIAGDTDISMLESFFQSVTCRTAGFNTVDIGNLHNSTLLIMMILMFIGGSPGSTAGGIKTTTFAILTFIMLLGKNNFEDVTASNKTLPKNIVYQALLVLLFSFVIVFFSIIFLTIFEPGTIFIKLLFEVFSAFGTVGLSTGITEGFTSSSKWVLMVTMFAGRIGSITIFSIFMNRNPGAIKYAEERILVG
jgi:trk system potassium uptake protein